MQRPSRKWGAFLQPSGNHWRDLGGSWSLLNISCNGHNTYRTSSNIRRKFLSSRTPMKDYSKKVARSLPDPLVKAHAFLLIFFFFFLISTRDSRLNICRKVGTHHDSFMCLTQPKLGVMWTHCIEYKVFLKYYLIFYKFWGHFIKESSYECMVSRLYLTLHFWNETFEGKFISKINSQNIGQHSSDTRSTLCTYEIIFSWDSNTAATLRDIWAIYQLLPTHEDIEKCFHTLMLRIFHQIMSSLIFVKNISFLYINATSLFWILTG